MQPKYKGLSKLKKVIWLYSKYQIITKGLLSIIIFPFSKFILNYLITSSGRTNISSGDYLKFIFSFQGVGALIMWLLLLILLTGIDINAFIIMSALINEGKVQMTARSMVLVAIKSLKSFLRPSGIFIMLYIAIVIPVIGIGITISPMERFQIPNFITSVIFANRLYSAIYYTLVIALFILSIRNIFLFHYVLILGDSIKEGSKNSCNLIKQHLKDFLKSEQLEFSTEFKAKCRYDNSNSLNNVMVTTDEDFNVIINEEIYPIDNCIYTFENNILEITKNEDIVEVFIDHSYHKHKLVRSLRR